MTIVTQNERRKLVRARPKLPDFMPEWARCCPAFIGEIQSYGEMTIDLYSPNKEPAGMNYCIFCMNPIPEALWVPDIADDRFIALELLDLDEGNQP